MLHAARAIGRGLMAGVVAVLLVVLSVLPDDVPATSASRGHEIASMQASSSTAVASRSAVVSVSSSDAEQPPGDGRDLGPALPTILRLPLPAGLSIAVAEQPPYLGSALLERPPKLV